MSSWLRRGPPFALAVRWSFIAYVGALIILPLLAVVATGLSNGIGGLTAVVMAPAARDALFLSLWTAAIIAVLNAIAGTATAWVLARYPLPGKRFLAQLVDVPLAIPTLVTGVMIVLLFGPARLGGRLLDGLGITVLYAVPAILLALAFITLPLVVRAVEPVLAQCDLAEEEAAATLGAGRTRIFWRVVFPALAPAIAGGALQSFARSLAEFGSIVVVSGNIPHRTLTGAVYVFSEVESGRPQVAAAASLVILMIAAVTALGARHLVRLSRAPAHA